MSGISYYTLHLTTALAAHERVSVILMRRLLPRRLYPGRERVGRELTPLRYPVGVPVLDGVDWYWMPSILRALGFLVRQRPTAVVFQWWTGTVLHTYLVLMLVVKLLGGRIVIEFHEVLDTAEARLWFARPYVVTVARLVTALADAYVIHSESDRTALERSYDIGRRRVAVIPHGPYDHLETSMPPLREAPPNVCNILFFGTIRPYKGLDDLVAAFNALSEEEARSLWLTVVGETWEGHDAPIRLIAGSPHRRRITLINRYVSDEEAARWFAGADVVALPYRRSSASGPLHVTMSLGLPVLVTSVGGLIEATTGYCGAILVPPGAPEEIRRALPRLASLRGQRFSDSHSWATSVTRYRALVAALERSLG